MEQRQRNGVLRHVREACRIQDQVTGKVISQVKLRNEALLGRKTVTDLYDP